jgi:hypothetical protein
VKKKTFDNQYTIPCDSEQKARLLRIVRFKGGRDYVSGAREAIEAFVRSEEKRLGLAPITESEIANFLQNKAQLRKALKV